MRYAESETFQGWKVLIHDPGEFPEVKKKGMYVGLGKEVSIRWGNKVGSLIRKDIFNGDIKLHF